MTTIRIDITGLDNDLMSNTADRVKHAVMSIEGIKALIEKKADNLSSLEELDLHKNFCFNYGRVVFCAHAYAVKETDSERRSGSTLAGSPGDRRHQCWPSSLPARPPIGVMPQKMWLEHRCKDLATAASMALDARDFRTPNLALAKVFVDELLEQLKKFTSPTNKPQHLA